MNDVSPAGSRSLRFLIAALAVLVVLLAGLIVWGLVNDSSDSEGESPAAVAEPGGGARVLSAGELAEIAAASVAPIYWAGERPGTELEYDEAGERSYVRYLTEGAEAGDPRPAFLTIATYPLADPAGALQANAKRTNTRVQRAPGGALVWANPDRPQSVYLAEPGSEFQVEVYDPLPRRALHVALSGDVKRVP